MPELPEVEVLRRQVECELVGASALAVPSLGIEGPMKIVAAKRIGKALCLQEEHGKYLVFRLGLTGDVFILHSYQPQLRKSKLTIQFDNDRILYFVDPRGFGKVSLEDSMPTMGPDVMQEESYVLELYRRLSGTTATIKSAIMDQSLLAGVGNAYAAEALWGVGINPMAAACTLTRVQVGVLIYKLRALMQEAIDVGSKLSAEEYYSTGGWKGAKDRMQVYGHEGEPCPRCGCPIARSIFNSRGTYYCPRCQKVGVSDA